MNTQVYIPAGTVHVRQTTVHLSYVKINEIYQLVFYLFGINMRWLGRDHNVQKQDPAAANNSTFCKHEHMWNPSGATLTDTKQEHDQARANHVSTVDASRICTCQVL